VVEDHEGVNVGPAAVRRVDGEEAGRVAPDGAVPGALPGGAAHDLGLTLREPLSTDRIRDPRHAKRVRRRVVEERADAGQEDRGEAGIGVAVRVVVLGLALYEPGRRCPRPGRDGSGLGPRQGSEGTDRRGGDHMTGDGGERGAHR
jgi:hypothetical protein